MNIDLTSFSFGSSLDSGTGTPSWGTSLGQSKPDYKFTNEGSEEIVVGMAYCAVNLDYTYLPLGKGSTTPKKASSYKEVKISSLFRKVYVNDLYIDYPFVMTLVTEFSDSHLGRHSIKYSEKSYYDDGKDKYDNSVFIARVREKLNISETACWFAYKINIVNQDELHFAVVVVDKEKSITYTDSQKRKEAWIKEIERSSGHKYENISNRANRISNDSFIPLLTALRTKPFLLLAGISGTGKSRIVRELARACWENDSEEYKTHKPRNFEMIQVKPNWHDSSELLGYVSRIGGSPVFEAGEFLKFVVKAWCEPEVPYFLCLDEMNLAPVEQYFAEYLSVIESRKLENGMIVTDPLLKKDNQGWYLSLISSLVGIKENEMLHTQFLNDGISIPQNLFVIGTVNMDETTFSFSRKVLDRAMTIEMNEVDLNGGLDENSVDEFGYIGNAVIPQSVEGKDVYADNKELCDKVIAYLKEVNDVLDKTPFKIAYRTRNEFLVYAVCRGEENLNNALDEMTSMKILSRIEGDADKTERVLNELETLLKSYFENLEKSISLSKIEEMIEKLDRTQYTSFWS